MNGVCLSQYASCCWRLKKMDDSCCWRLKKMDDSLATVAARQMEFCHYSLPILVGLSLRKCLEDCLRNLILYLPSLFVGPTYLSISIFPSNLVHTTPASPYPPTRLHHTYTATPHPGYHHHSTTRHAGGAPPPVLHRPVPPPFAAGRPLLPLPLATPLFSTSSGPSFVAATSSTRSTLSGLLASVVKTQVS
jgi:hypothetical protein